MIHDVMGWHFIKECGSEWRRHFNVRFKINILVSLIWKMRDIAFRIMSFCLC